MNINMSTYISPLELFQNVLKSYWSGLSNAFGIGSNGDLLAELRRLLVDDPTRIFKNSFLMTYKTQNSNKFNENCTPTYDFRCQLKTIVSDESVGTDSKRFGKLRAVAFQCAWNSMQRSHISGDLFSFS